MTIQELAITSFVFGVVTAVLIYTSLYMFFVGVQS
jgi:hypothetical protein